MHSKDVVILLNSTLSLVELIIRLRSQHNFEGEEEKLEKLAELTEELKSKPNDYLQRWEPGED